MGIRAGFGAAEDESLPWLAGEAPSIEVAADFTGIYRILMWPGALGAKTVGFAVTKVPVEQHFGFEFGKKRRLP